MPRYSFDWVNPGFLVFAACLSIGLSIGLSSCSGPSATSVTASPTPTQSEPQASPSIAPTMPSPSATSAQINRNLEQILTGELTKQLGGVAIGAVTCPAQAKFTAGTVFDCQAQISNGTFPVTVTIQDDKGNFTFKTKQIAMLPKIESFLQQGIKDKSGVDVKANCGGKVLLIKQSGQTVECKLIDPAGKPGSATVTIKDENNVDAKWKL